MESSGTPAIWPSEVAHEDFTPYAYLASRPRSQSDLPDFVEWCTGRGLIEEPLAYVKSERWYDQLCMAPYLRFRGVPKTAIALFVRTSITLSEMSSAGPITVAHGAVESEYYVNDFWDDFIFTPEGMLDLRSAFSTEAREAFWDAIEATDLFSEIRALHFSDPPLEANMWWDVSVGKPTSVSSGYAVPMQWLMHEFCHACETPYGISARLRFDQAGIFQALEFEGFCVDPGGLDAGLGWGPDPLGLPECDLIV